MLNGSEKVASYNEAKMRIPASGSSANTWTRIVGIPAKGGVRPVIILTSSTQGHASTQHRQRSSEVVQAERSLHGP